MAEKPLEILTVDGLAQRLHMHPASLRRLCAEGRVPHLKVGGAIRFCWPTVLNQLEQRN